MENILCYARPWNKEQFSRLVKEIDPASNLILCSEHASTDESGLREEYYKILKNNSVLDTGVIPEISKAQALDVISRCRLLRSLKRQTAERHLIAMTLAIKSVFRERKVDSVFSLTVDSYIMDLMRILSKHYEIRFIGIIGTFVNGHFRVTSRGEVTTNKDPEVNFAELVGPKLLSPEYTPAFNAKSIKSPIKSVYRRWVANTARIPFFFLKRHLTGDAYNYHYWASQLVAQENFNFLPPRDPGRHDWEDFIQKEKKPSLLIPLQMFPECTVDYWCEDSGVIKYYEMLEKTIEKLCDDFFIFLKEHPSVMGVRPSGFYSKIKKDPRVIVIPTYTPSNYILEKIDGVVVWTGSVGFEALLRGKAVLGLATPFYASGHRFRKISLSTPNNEIVKHVTSCAESKITKDEQKHVLDKLGSQLYKGNFKNDKSWAKESLSDLNDTSAMALSIRKTLSRSK